MKIHTDHIKAFIMDMDGVVTDTARIHAAAWKRMFDEYLEKSLGQAGSDLHPFDLDRDYRDYLDGKPRYDGVQRFLASRHISLPYGDPDDNPDRETICGLGNRKNRYYLELIERQGVTPFPSTLVSPNNMASRTLLSPNSCELG